MKDETTKRPGNRPATRHDSTNLGKIHVHHKYRWILDVLMSWCVLARSHSRRQQPAMDSTIFQVGICKNTRCKRRWQIVILRKHIVRIEFCEIKRLCHLHCFILMLRQFQSDFQWFSPCSGRAKLALDVQKLILPRHLETQSAVESFVSVALRTGRRNPSAETEQSSDENKEGTFFVPSCQVWLWAFSWRRSKMSSFHFSSFRKSRPCWDWIQLEQNNETQQNNIQKKRQATNSHNVARRAGYDWAQRTIHQRTWGWQVEFVGVKWGEYTLGLSTLLQHCFKIFQPLFRMSCS